MTTKYTVEIMHGGYKSTQFTADKEAMQHIWRQWRRTKDWPWVLRVLWPTYHSVFEIHDLTHGGRVIGIDLTQVHCIVTTVLKDTP